MADGFVGTAWIQVSPSFQGFQAQMQRELQRSMPQLGIQAGTELGKGMEAPAAKTGRTISSAIGDGLRNIKTTGLEAVDRALTSVGRSALTAGGLFATAAAGFGVYAAKSAMRVDELDIAMRAVAKSSNLSYPELQNVVKAIRGQGIEAAEAQQLVIDFARANMNMADASKLARVAQDAAVIGQMNSTEATQTLMHGINTLNPVILRQLGIMVSADQAYESYAATIGKSAKDLSGAEKQQAFLNEVLRQGASIAGTYEAAMDAPGKLIRSFPRLFNDAAVAVGSVFTPALSGVIKPFYDVTKQISHALDEGGKLRPVVLAVGQAVTTWIEPLKTVAVHLQNWFKNLRADQVDRLAKSFRDIAPVIPAVGGALAVFAGKNLAGSIPILGQFVGNLNPIYGSLIGLVLTMPGVQQALGQLVKAFTPLVPTVLSILPPLQRLLDALIVPLSKALVALVEPSVEIVQALVPFIGVAASLLTIFVKLIDPILDPLARVLMPLLIAAFIQWKWSIATNPWVIAGMAFMAIMEKFGSVGRIITFVVLGIAAAIWLWNSAIIANTIALLANPITWIFIAIVAAIAAVVAAIVLLVKHWDTVWGAITSAASWAWNNILKPVIDAIVKAFNWVVDLIKGPWGNAILGAVAIFMPFIGIPLLIIKNWDVLKGFFIALWDAIAGAFSWAYNNILKPIIDGVVAAWNGMVAAMVWAWENILQPVFQVMWVIIRLLLLPIIALFLVFQLAWEAACKAFSWAVENIIKPAVNAVAAAFQWVWNTIVQPIFNFFVAAWNALGAAFAWVQAFVIKPTIDALAAAVQWVWNYVVNPVFAAFRATWEALGMAFRWVNDTIIQPTWQALQAAFQAGWNFIRDFVINPLRAAWQAMGEFFNWVKVNIIDKVWEGIKSGISAVRDTFSTVVDAIRAIWDGIKKVFGTPVKFVLEKVVIPLMKGANFILDKVGLGIGGEIGSLEGMARDIPSFARGGLVPGRAHGPGDNQLAFVRSGEWILTDRQVAAIGIANLRRLPRFSEGGLVGDDGRYGASDDPWAIFEMLWLVDKVKEGISAVGGGLASAVGAAWEGMTSLAGDLINTATGLIRFAAAAAFEAGTIPLKKLLEMVPGDTPVAGWISKFGIYIIDEVVKLIKGKSDKEEFLGGGLGIDQVVAMIRERFPQLVVTSALRPGDPGYHGKGLARDLGGPANVMAEAAAWTQLNLVSALLEGIHRGLGGKNLSVKNGKPVDPSFWGASTWAGHADHLHLASEATALSGPVSGSVAQWAAEGIRLAGVGQEWLQPLITRAMIESGGDPRVTQKIQDINSARGDPAKGLMQFISGTWRAYAAPGMTDIFNPIHAMVAAIRYVSAKPGGLAYLLRQNALRQGYDAGGWLPTGTSIAVNNTGRPEPVLSAEQWDRLQAGAAGPAIQINQATFAQEVDVELLLRKAAWYLQTRSA